MHGKGHECVLGVRNSHCLCYIILREYGTAEYGRNASAMCLPGSLHAWMFFLDTGVRDVQKL